MDLTIAGSAFSFTPNDDQLSRISLELAAFDGEIGNGIFPAPDPDGTIIPVTGRQFRVDEGATLVSNGYMLDWDRVRGPFRVGAEREYDITVMDANALLGGFRFQRKRPQESDYARVIAAAAVDGPTWDTTWVLNSSTVTMSAKQYNSDGGWTNELIPDLVAATGKTMFLHDKAAGGRCLHYHILTTGHTCGLTISDVHSAVNGTTVFAPRTPGFSRTSVDLRNDIQVRDQNNNVVSVIDATSITNHDTDGLQHQSLVDVDATGSNAIAIADALLASQKEDYDTRTCAIGPLDATALGLIRVGDIITVTSALMGLVATDKRIAHMTLTPWAGDGPPAPGLWLATLELEAPLRRRARIRYLAPAPAPAPPYNPDNCDIESADIDDFNRTVGAGSSFGTASSGPSWTGGNIGTGYVSVSPASGGKMAFQTAAVAGTSNYALQTLTYSVGSAHTFYLSFQFEEVLGTGHYQQFRCQLSTGAGIYIVMTDGTVGVETVGTWLKLADGGISTSEVQVLDDVVVGTQYFVRWQWDQSTGEHNASFWSQGELEPALWQVSGTATPTADPTSVNLRWDQLDAGSTGIEQAVVVRSLTICQPSNPLTGQVINEIIGTGDGSSTSFGLTYTAQSPGSVKVFVDGLRVFLFTASVSDVTFDIAPDVGEVIRAEYTFAGGV